MDAWEQLISRSTAIDGSDAFEHLLGQDGDPYPVYVEGVRTVSNIETLTMTLSTENRTVFGE